MMLICNDCEDVKNNVNNTSQEMSYNKSFRNLIKCKARKWKHWNPWLTSTGHHGVNNKIRTDSVTSSILHSALGNKRERQGERWILAKLSRTSFLKSWQGLCSHTKNRVLLKSFCRPWPKNRASFPREAWVESRRYDRHFNSTWQ